MRPLPPSGFKTQALICAMFNKHTFSYFPFNCFLNFTHLDTPDGPWLISKSPACLTRTK